MTDRIVFEEFWKSILDVAEDSLHPERLTKIAQSDIASDSAARFSICSSTSRRRARG